MGAEVVVKKWGNSLGVILPKDMVEKQHLKEEDRIIVNVVKEADLTKMYGSLKGKIKMSGQQFKDMAREGWNLCIRSS